MTGQFCYIVFVYQKSMHYLLTVWYHMIWQSFWTLQFIYVFVITTILFRWSNTVMLKKNYQCVKVWKNIYDNISNYHGQIFVYLSPLHLVICISIKTISNIVKQLSTDYSLFRLVCYTSKLTINNILVLDELCL